MTPETLWNQPSARWKGLVSIASYAESISSYDIDVATISMTHLYQCKFRSKAERIVTLTITS